MIGKIIGAVLCFILVVIRAGAQELGIELDGGLQGMHYPLQGGQTKLLPGGSLGVNYTFGLGSQWGLLTGVSGGLYRTQATLQDGRFTYGRVDEAGSAFEYNLKVTGYKEVQHFYAVSIPVLLQYHTAGAGSEWYVDGGGRVIIPWGSGAAVSADQMGLAGYYPDLNLTVSNLPQHGFGTINNWKSSASFSLKPTVAFSAGTGVSFAVAPGSRLYAGVYVDLGLTNLTDKQDSMPLVNYSSAGVSGAKANGVMNMEGAGKAKLFGVGLMVRLSFGAAKAKPRAHRRVDSVAVTGMQFEVHEETVQTERTERTERTEPRRDTVSKPQAVTPQPVIAQPVIAQPVIAQPVTTPKPATKPSTLSQDELDLIQTPVVFGVVGGALIPALQKEHLDKVADIMKQHPEIRISIVGHMCNSGSETEDAKVGMARAVAIQRYLQSKGISRKSKRIEVSAAAEIEQGDPGDPAANYWKRRAEITVE